MYWIAWTVNRNDETTVHLVDDIDCMPPDVYGPVRRIPERGGKTLAGQTLLNVARMLRHDSYGGLTVHVSANVTEGCFETFKSVQQWSGCN